MSATTMVTVHTLELSHALGLVDGHLAEKCELSLFLLLLGLELLATLLLRKLIRE